MILRFSISVLALLFLMTPNPVKGDDPLSHPDQNIDLNFMQLDWPMTLSARIDIPAPPDIVWQVLTDYDHLTDFLPQMESSHVIRRTEEEIVIEQTTRTHFLFFRKKIAVTLNVLEKKTEEISFSKIGGNMEIFSGKWILAEIESGESTRLTYLLKFKPSFYVPRWVIRDTLSHEIPEQLQLISKRAEKTKLK